MGETGRSELTDQRVSELLPAVVGSVASSLDAVYDCLFALAVDAYKAEGSVPHVVIGLTVEAGRAAIASIIGVEDDTIDRVPAYLELTLLRYPVAAHMTKGWISPAGAGMPSSHPARRNVVLIVVHTEVSVFMAACDTDPATRTLTKAPLENMTDFQGRIARPLPQKH